MSPMVGFVYDDVGCVQLLSAHRADKQWWVLVTYIRPPPQHEVVFYRVVVGAQRGRRSTLDRMPSMQHALLSSHHLSAKIQPLHDSCGRRGILSVTAAQLLTVEKKPVSLRRCC